MSEPPTRDAGPAGSKAVRSDPPPEDLKRERDTFIQQFFRRGAQLSEELLGDIERLREQVRELDAENAKLRSQIASDTAIRDLLKKIEQLEEEKRQLLLQTTHGGGGGGEEFSHRFAELEAELAHLGTLHVASVQLHASTTVRRAFRNLRELLAQFLGAAQFAVYWEAEDATLVPINVENISSKEARAVVFDDTPAGAAYHRNEIFIDDGDTSVGSVRRPAALIPLMMSSQRLGAIVVFRTLSQKTHIEPADFGLLKLLSTQAAAAIVHAHLFSQAGRRAPTVQAFIDQED
ncbi:MAG: hypothetical protein JNL21_17535 [Myxococcales bacterium]|nr:hypothetical protein [Myxococcales bacterium]